MTIDHPVRHLLARLCSPDTMHGIVDPVLADIRWEDGRLTWRGYIALVRALGMHALVSVPGVAARVWSDDGRAVPRAAGLTMVWGLLGAIPLIVVPFSQFIRTSSIPGWLLLTLVPQAVALTLPAALLVAVPIALRRAQPSTQLVARMVLLSMLYAGVTLGVIGWVVPAANQAFRVAASGIANPQRGPAETPLVHLKAEIARMRTFHGSDRIVRDLEYEYEMRLALGTAALPLGLAALAMAFTPFGRKHPVLAGVGALVVYVLAIFPFEAMVKGLVLRHTSLPVASIAWLPNAILVFSAGVLAASVTRRRQISG